MPARRARRLTTLDEFLTTTRELARRSREEGVDTETLIARVAEEAARRVLESRMEARLAPEDVTLVAKIVSEAVASTVSKLLEERLSRITSMLEEITAELRRLREEVRTSRASTRENREREQLPPWARKLAKMLEESPFVKLHETGIDPLRVKSDPRILSQLDAVIVETSSGLYLVPRKSWAALLERLSVLRSRDEEEALRAAGPYAEIVAALLRDNMLYYNNGWRILRDAIYEPR